MKRPLSRLTRRPSPISYGEYACASIIAFLLLKKSTSMSSSPASMRATSSASMPAGLMSNGLPCVHQRIPDAHRVLRRHPDLIAEIARVAGSRDVDRHARDRAAASRGSTSSMSMFALGRRAQQAGGRRTLQRKRRDLFRDVFDRRRRVRRRSAETTAGSGPPRSSGTRCSPSRATVPSSITRPVLVAPRRVEDLPDRHLRRRRA